MEDMQEALEGKASKQSVANALHRKANRCDLEAALEAKADASDVEKVCGLLEGKAEAAQVEALVRLIEAKVDKSEVLAIRGEMAAKCERQDVDLYIRAVQGQRTDFEERQGRMEREFDQLVDTIQKELESLKATTLQSLSKKADYSLVEHLREATLKKVDHDYLQVASNKIKSECQALISTFISDFTVSRR